VILAVALLAGCQGEDDSTSVESASTAQVATTTSAQNEGSFERIPQIVDQVQPSVVSVITDTGQGSGVVYREDGFVVTNNHVAGGAAKVVVVLANGQRLPARVRGTSEIYDLAVLKVDRDDLPAASFADALPKVGSLAIAMGNPLGFENSVTAGIVSGLNREIPSGGQAPSLVDLIQTDAPISPGNSGGALVGGDSEVIGINVAYLPPTAGAVSVGFAIPAPTAVHAVDQLIENGKVNVAYLGIRPVQVTPDLNQAFDLGADTGVLVSAVIEGGPSAKAGVKAGDVIVQMDDRKIELVEDLFAELREHQPGTTVTLTITRKGEQKKVDVTLGTLPER
jgi:serine protease DegQ